MKKQILVFGTNHMPHTCEETSKQNAQELPKSPEHFGDLIVELCYAWQERFKSRIVQWSCSAQISSLYRDPPSDTAIPWNTHPVLAFSSEY